MPSKPKTKIIGVTGGIASGKSTVSEYLRKMGHPVICADEIARDQTKKGKPAIKKIVAVFGKGILSAPGELNRKKLGHIVFTSEKNRKKLENILHPLVRKKIKSEIIQLKKRKIQIVFIDAPLLFESGLSKICDQVLCVATTRQHQIQRLKKHRNMSHRHATKRIQSQWPLSKKVKLSNWVLYNKTTKRKLFSDLDKILAFMCS